MGADQQPPGPQLAGPGAPAGAALALCHPSGGSAPGLSRYQPPVLLAARHQLAGFRCRSEEGSTWLVEVAKQAHGTVTNRVFLVTLVDQTAVVACYAWFMASVAIADLLARLRRGASPYPQPVALLARPAVGCDQPGR